MDANTWMRRGRKQRVFEQIFFQTKVVLESWDLAS